MLLLLACFSPPDLPSEAGLAVEARLPESRSSSGKRTIRNLTVDCQGGANYTSIEDALDDARSGDLISVAPCTYPGSLSLKGKAVQLESTGGAAVTIIVADPGESAIKVKNGEGPGTIIAGFTITGGGSSEDGAIEVQSSSLVLRDSLVTGNGGRSILYSNNGHVVVERTTFEDNVPTEGMVIRERRGTTLLKDSLVRCGNAPVGYITEHGAGFVDGSTFDCPGLTALEIYHSHGRIQRSVLDGMLKIENETTELERAVVEDTLLLEGATIEVAHTTLRNIVSLGPITVAGSTLVVEGSILTEAACGIDAATSDVTVRYTNFWSNTNNVCGMDSPLGANGNLSENPQFVDSGAGNFALSSGSPCVNAGPDEDGYADPDGSRNDLGVYGGPLSIGGGW